MNSIYLSELNITTVIILKFRCYLNELNMNSQVRLLVTDIDEK